MISWINLTRVQGVALMVALVACFMALLWFSLPKPAQAPEMASKQAQTAPQLAKVGTVSLTTAKVKAYQPKAKATLGLPAKVVDNPDAHVLGATTVKPGIRPVTVSTVLDEETGDVTVYEKTEPLPWVALPHRGEVGITYGFKGGVDGIKPNARLFVRQSLLDVKALRIGVEVTADQDGDAFAGASLSYRW
jgi:hypothetical protein